MQYDNENKGVLFVNKDKKSDKHPDFTGPIDVGGYQKRIAGWVRRDENGKLKLISLEISEVRERRDEVVDDNTFNLDDIPF